MRGRCPQERYNAEWVREMGVGIVLPNFRGIARAVEELLEPAAYQRFRNATERLENRAVFEIPEILERIAQAARMKVHGFGKSLGQTPWNASRRHLGRH